MAPRTTAVETIPPTPSTMTAMAARPTTITVSTIRSTTIVPEHRGPAHALAFTESVGADELTETSR